MLYAVAVIPPSLWFGCHCKVSNSGCVSCVLNADEQVFGFITSATVYTVKIVPCGHRCWCICCEWNCSLMSSSKSCSSLVYYAEITIRLTWFPFEEVIQGSELLASYTCPASCLALRRIAQLSAVRHRLLAFVSSHVLLYNYHCLHLLKYLVWQIKVLLSSISMFSHVYPPRKIGRVPVHLHW